MNNEIDGMALIPGTVVGSNGTWRTTTFDDPGDKTGVVGCRWRVLATAILAKQYPTALIFISGGIDQPGGPVVAQVVQAELEQLGVDQSRIILEKTAVNTFEQLLEVGRAISRLGWRHFGLVTNRYHIFRIAAMLQYLPLLPPLFIPATIQFFSAEEVLVENDPGRWRPIVDGVYRSEAMRARLACELRGVADIQEGRYEPRLCRAAP
ncbi:MAG: YdcF family protein [Patescibacteria group bacterium]|jgi:hypothetical protein|nr:YdcF family protein [Patescibacteria group bacterium]